VNQLLFQIFFLKNNCNDKTFDANPLIDYTNLIIGIFYLLANDYPLFKISGSFVLSLLRSKLTLFFN
jgi:hypothetical protein